MAGTKEESCDKCIYSNFDIWRSQDDDKCFKCMQASEYKEKSNNKLSGLSALRICYAK